MVTPEIISYIQSQLVAGVSADTVTQTLQQQGWTPEDIQEAFRASTEGISPLPDMPSVNPSPTSTSNPVTGGSPASGGWSIGKIILGLFGIAILAVVGVTAYGAFAFYNGDLNLGFICTISEDVVDNVIPANTPSDMKQMMHTDSDNMCRCATVEMPAYIKKNHSVGTAGNALSLFINSYFQWIHNMFGAATSNKAIETGNADFPVYACPFNGGSLLAPTASSTSPTTSGQDLGNTGLGLMMSTTTNLLINPGAENGNLTGWISDEGLGAVNNGSFDRGINIHKGAYDFYGKSGSQAVMLSQTVSLVGNQGITAAKIDSGKSIASISFWEENLNQGTIDDNASVSLEFLDSSGNVISTSSSPVVDSQENTWTNYSGKFAIPVGTRSIKYSMNFFLHVGKDIDAFIDDNSLIVTN